MNPEETKVKSGEDAEGKSIDQATSAGPKGMKGMDTIEATSASADSGEMAQTDGHFTLRSLRAEAEIYALSKTLEYTGWNRRRAAQLLSISYRGILYKIRQHNLTPRSVPVQAAAQAGQGFKAE